jgi:Polyketide cyclase / dehydrase and lipid transport
VIKWMLLAVVALVVLLAAVVAVVGARAPVRHVARVALSLEEAPAEVWAVVSDLATWPTWNDAIQKMERAPDVDGRPVWAFTARGDVMRSEIVEATPPSDDRPGRLVTRIIDDELPFGGTWTWEIRGAGRGTAVTITEDGFIKNAFFRGMSSLFFGYIGSQKAYLGALAKKFGSASAPVVESVTFPQAGVR